MHGSERKLPRGDDIHGRGTQKLIAERQRHGKLLYISWHKQNSIFLICRFCAIATMHFDTVLAESFHFTALRA